MRPIITHQGIPPGYVLESAAVGYGSKRTFTVSREAQRDYEIGQPVVLVQDGKYVHAVVQRCVCSGAVTTVTVNAAVSATIFSVARDITQAHSYGIDPEYTQGLYHFDTATLYDSSVNARDAGVAGLTVRGGGGTLTTASPTPLFGSGCYSFSGGQCYGDLNFPFSVGGRTKWCIEAWFWGIPSGYFMSTNTGAQDSRLGFAAGYPTMYTTGGPNLTSSIALGAAAHNHVAWVRDNAGYFKIYVNGVSAATSALGLSWTGPLYCLFGHAGYSGSWAWSGSFSGIVEELRITLDYCPYNAPFAVHHKPFGPDFR